MINARTTYARAAAGYDDEHERQLVEAVTRAVIEASKVSDCDAVVIRTAETASALLTALATVLAMSPTVVRTPRAMRLTLDELGKRLRRRVAAAETDGELLRFMKRVFYGNDIGGCA